MTLLEALSLTRRMNEDDTFFLLSRSILVEDDASYERQGLCHIKMMLNYFEC